MLLVLHWLGHACDHHVNHLCALQLLALIGDQFQKPGHVCGVGMCLDWFHIWCHFVGVPLWVTVCNHFTPGCVPFVLTWKCSVLGIRCELRNFLAWVYWVLPYLVMGPWLSSLSGFKEEEGR